MPAARHGAPRVSRASGDGGADGPDTRGGVFGIHHLSLHFQEPCPPTGKSGPTTGTGELETRALGRYKDTTSWVCPSAPPLPLCPGHLDPRIPDATPGFPGTLASDRVTAGPAGM